MKHYRKLALKLKEDKFEKDFDHWMQNKFRLSQEDVEEQYTIMSTEDMVKAVECFMYEVRYSAKNK